MHILKTDVNGNPNIGLYGFVNDKFCLLGREVAEKTVKQIEEVLDVPVYQINIAGTSLVGVFVVGNNNVLLVPSIAFENEIQELQKLDVDIKIIDTKLTALGNNILMNDHGCIVGKEFDKNSIDQIKEATGMDVKTGIIAESEVLGSCAAVTNEFGYVNENIEEFEKEFVSQTLKISLSEGTVNMGNPYPKSGIIVNKKGFVIGKLSTGIETAAVDEAFGFLPEQ